MDKNRYSNTNLTNLCGTVDGTIKIVNEYMEATIFVHASRVDLAFSKGKMIILGRKIRLAALQYIDRAKEEQQDDSPTEFIFSSIPELENYKGLINVSIDFKDGKESYISDVDTIDKARAWEYIGVKIINLAGKNFLEAFYK